MRKVGKKLREVPLRLEEEDEADWIRKNVPRERLERVKQEMTKALKLHPPETYLSETLMEHVYRAHKGSCKIAYCYSEAVRCIQLLFHLLFGDELEADPEPRVREAPHVMRQFRRMRRSHEKNIVKTKTGWIDIDKAVLPLLGGVTYFYTTLMATVCFCEKALNNPEYKVPTVVDWDEAVACYLLAEYISPLKPHAKEMLKKTKKEPNLL